MRLASILAVTAMAFSIPCAPITGFGPYVVDRFAFVGFTRAPAWLASSGYSGKTRRRRHSQRKPNPAGTKLAKKAARGRLTINSIK